MNLFGFFGKQASAPKARDRLQILLAHERASVGDSDLVTRLREEIIAVVAKHVKVDSEKVNVAMDRGDQVSTLEIDVEIPFKADAKAS